MPTPHEIRRYESGSQGRLASTLTAAGRPRPQLACPDEIPTTLSQWRQSVANNHQSQTVPNLASPLVESTPASTDPNLFDSQPGLDCSGDQTSIPSPTGSIEQKFSLRNSITSLSSSSDLAESHSPLSLSREYSTTRVCSRLPLIYYFTPNRAQCFSFCHQHHALFSDPGLGL